MRYIMKRIRSKLHTIETYEVCKTSLHCFDDKICILCDDINNVAYSHKNVLKIFKNVLNI